MYFSLHFTGACDSGRVQSACSATSGAMIAQQAALITELHNFPTLYQFCMRVLRTDFKGAKVANVVTATIAAMIII